MISAFIVVHMKINKRNVILGASRYIYIYIYIYKINTNEKRSPVNVFDGTAANDEHLLFVTLSILWCIYTSEEK